MTFYHDRATFSAAKAKQWGYIRAVPWILVTRGSKSRGGWGKACGCVSKEEGYKTQVASSSVSNTHLTISFMKTT